MNAETWKENTESTVHEKICARIYFLDKKSTSPLLNNTSSNSETSCSRFSHQPLNMYAKNGDQSITLGQLNQFSSKIFNPRAIHRNLIMS